MKKWLLSFLIITSANILFAQNFTGQWKGSFVDNSAIISWGSNRCDYVIDLDVRGTDISGYSYTYFNEDGKKYYTICKLKGILDKKKKYIEVTETERTKTNVPREVINSFQLHKLRWRREAGKEILEGSWEPAPGQSRKNTGFGTTILTKRQLTEVAPLAKKQTPDISPFSKPKKKEDASITPKINTAKTKKILPPTIAQKTITKHSTVAKPSVKATQKINPKPIAKLPVKTPTKVIATATKKDTLPKKITPRNIEVVTEKIPLNSFEKRNNTILQTVEVENPIVYIEIYDNGEIDGDSISLFYNGKVLLAHKMLSTQPIKLDLPINNDEVNELVMYADNLGTIPPNTALMIVMDGNKRYEVRMTSDLKKSGTIRFIHPKK